ncbi:MAG: ATP-binding protein [Chitinophagaceae bacterium]|nr:ATP-binding protein [Chitinophagaceae bacterium]
MTDSLVTGREAEKAILDSITASSKASLVAVYGRRRVGKTYLIRTCLQKQMVFQFSGVHYVTTEIQLEQFTTALSKQLNKGIDLPVPADWFKAFELLSKLLAKKIRTKKAVVFLDEFPWMQTPKSNFLSAFEHFWNTWAAQQNNLAVILCGSAASWMLQEVVRNRGGLHNRITHKIPLMPFTLYETEQFLRYKNIQLNHYEITQLYMTMGGIPYYLEQAKPGLSAAQITDAACFTKNGFLYKEFTELYQSLFDKADRHIKVVRALAAKPMGLSRSQIIKTCKLQSGGSTTALLEDLTASGFITPYLPVGKKTKDNIYKLTDAFSLFYLKFMEPNRSGGKGTWLRLSDTPSWKSWSGLAFETVCLRHLPAVKRALGISGMYTQASIWRSKNNSDKDAVQVDLVLTRRDNCINLFELKFCNDVFVIDKKYAAALLKNKNSFKQETQTRKQLFITLITSMGLRINEHSLGLVDQSLTIDQLFVPFEYED